MVALVPFVLFHEDVSLVGLLEVYFTTDVEFSKNFVHVSYLILTRKHSVMAIEVTGNNFFIVLALFLYKVHISFFEQLFIVTSRCNHDHHLIDHHSFLAQILEILFMLFVIGDSEGDEREVREKFMVDLVWMGVLLIL